MAAPNPAMHAGLPHYEMTAATLPTGLACAIGLVAGLHGGLMRMF